MSAPDHRQPNDSDIAIAESQSVPTVPTSSCAHRLLGSLHTPLWSSGLVLAVCFGLPVCSCGGCVGPSKLYPSQMLQVTDLDFFFLLGVLFVWPYLFGLLTFCGTVYGVCSRHPLRYRAIWLALSGIIAVTSLGVWRATGNAMREIISQDASVHDANTAMIVLTAGEVIGTWILLFVVIGTYKNCRTWFSASLWLQFALAVTALLWFIYLPVLEGELLIGGELALGASLCIAISAVLLRRFAHEAHIEELKMIHRNRSSSRPPLDPMRVPPVATLRAQVDRDAAKNTHRIFSADAYPPRDAAWVVGGIGTVSVLGVILAWLLLR